MSFKQYKKKYSKYFTNWRTAAIVVVCCLGVYRADMYPHKDAVDEEVGSASQHEEFSKLANPTPESKKFNEAKAEYKAKPRAIVLNSRNTVVLRSVIDTLSVAQIQRDLLAKSKELGKNEEIYLVLDTPGGSVDDGNNMVATANSLPQKVSTITVFAASMGFHTVQALSGKRYAITSGQIMQHKAALGGLGGEINGNFNTRANYITDSVDQMEKVEADRIGTSLNNFQSVIHDEYWATAKRAEAQNVIDEVISIRCDSSLDGTHDMVLDAGIFQANLTYSDCPAITGPLDVKIHISETLTRLVKEAKDLNTSNKDSPFLIQDAVTSSSETIQSKKQEFTQTVYLYLYNKPAFARYLLTNKNPFDHMVTNDSNR